MPHLRIRRGAASLPVLALTALGVLAGVGLFAAASGAGTVRLDGRTAALVRDAEQVLATAQAMGPYAVTVHGVPTGFRVADSFTSTPEGVVRNGVRTESTPIERGTVHVLRLEIIPGVKVVPVGAVDLTPSIVVAIREGSSRAEVEGWIAAGRATRIDDADRFLVDYVTPNADWRAVAWSRDDGTTVWVNGRGIAPAVLAQMARSIEVEGGVR